MRAVSDKKETRPLIFAGYKAGMTQVSFVETKKSVSQGHEILKAVTVLETPSLVVAGFKTYAKTPYGLKEKNLVLSEKLDKNLRRKTFLPKNQDKQKLELVEKTLNKVGEIRLLVHTKPKESGIGKKRPELFEVDLSGDVASKFAYAKQKLGQEIKPEDVVKEGEYVDVKAIDTGKGFQGPVKRFGIKVRSRKNKLKMRHTGTLGPYTPNRVLPGKIPEAGQMGFQTRTEFNKRIVKIGSGNVTPKGGFIEYGVVKGPYVLIEGSVPGPKKRLIFFRKAIRMPGVEHPIKVEQIVLDSQQGV